MQLDLSRFGSLTNEQVYSKILPKKEVKELPQEFKTLAGITVWILFISGCVHIFASTLFWVVNLGSNPTPDLAMRVSWGLGFAALFLSVVAAKLRQMLE